MFKWIRKEKSKMVKPNKSMVVRIVRTSNSPTLPIITPKITDTITNSSHQRNHMLKTLSGSSIGALTGIILLVVAAHLGFKAPLSDISVMIGLPLLLGALTGYVVL